MVQEARQALLKRHENLSIDAIRIELGNTGSKSTIHRYLKELEQGTPSEQHSVSLTEEIGQLVAQLAERLEKEAWACIAQEKEALAEERVALHAQLQAANNRIQQLEQQNQENAKGLEQAIQAHQILHQQWQQSEVERVRLTQAHQDLALRLQDRDQQILSLEEKHQHARNALEHYRQASKEQREQELRRHEAQEQQLHAEIRQLQQTLIIRQDALTTLNRTNERLLTEANHQAKAIQLQEQQLMEYQQQRDELGKQLVQRNTELAMSQIYMQHAQADKAQQQEMLQEQNKQLSALQAELLREQFEGKRISEALKAELLSTQEQLNARIQQLQAELEPFKITKNNNPR